MLYTTDINEVLSIAIMIIFYSLVYFYIATQVKNNLKLNLLIIIVIIARIILTLIDTYYKYLPNSGADSVGFESHAYQLLTGMLSLKTYNFDNYPKLIYLIYLIIGRKPIVIRTINGILSMLTGLLVYKTIRIINNDEKKASKGMGAYLIFPHSMIFSSIILRESIIVYLSTLSIYYFVRYTYDKKIFTIIKSYIAIGIAALFHAGIIFISVPYFFYILRDRTKGIYNKIKKNLVCILLIGMVGIILAKPHIFLRKVAFLSSPEALFKRLSASNEYGSRANIGSAYLGSFSIHSFKDLIIYTPLKIVYFLFSPMIWDIRGVSDIIAIVLDAIFYIILILKILIGLRKIEPNNKKKPLINILIICFIFVTGVYAMGTMAAGTAIRHRYKVLSLLIIILMSLDKKDRL